jgi:hypothetical protein
MRPHQTFRTVHHSTPVRVSWKSIEDQSFLTRFVKGLAGIAAIARDAVLF